MSETRPCMKLKLSDRKPSVFDSKVGGVGYLPHEMDVPTNKQGNQLRLLAQINCADVELDNFPKQGILQFWILNDSMAGLGFEDPTEQEGFRIVYHPFVDETVTETELTFKVFGNPFDDESIFPVKGEFALDMEIIEESDEEYKDEDSPLSGHKIGGFPLKTAYDPRKNNDYHDFLLLQLDSDYGSCIDEEGKCRFKENIMWDDAGVGQFFINRESLKLLDFSDVIYHWDCT